MDDNHSIINVYICNMKLTYQFNEGDLVHGFTFIRYDGYKSGGGRAAIFKCKFCEKEFRCYLADVAAGRRESCGCIAKLKNIKHGATRFKVSTPEFKVWCAMKSRCYKPNIKAFKYYGARGISMCERWLNSFENFVSDMGFRPSPKHSIERNDVDGNYEPSNCRWATPKEQANNQRNNVKVEYKGRTQNVKTWCEELRLNYARVSFRIRRGWNVEDAFYKSPANKGYRAINRIRLQKEGIFVSHTFGVINISN